MRDSGSVVNKSEIRWERVKAQWPEGHRVCTKCEKIKPFKEFHKHSGCAYGVNSVCKPCRRPRSIKNYGDTRIEKRLYNAAKSRASGKGLPFSLELEDIVIPALCPVLGIPMTSPSIDQKIPRGGYTKDNIQVISRRANTLKNNASSTELELVLTYVRQCEVVDL